jgi:hypothetical protein
MPFRDKANGAQHLKNGGTNHGIGGVEAVANNLERGMRKWAL